MMYVLHIIALMICAFVAFAGLMNASITFFTFGRTKSVKHALYGTVWTFVGMIALAIALYGTIKLVQVGN